MKKKNDWEVVSTRGMCGDTCRLKVPGGWLYRERECGARDGCTTAVAITFVRVPDARTQMDTLRYFGEIPM